MGVRMQDAGEQRATMDQNLIRPPAGGLLQSSGVAVDTLHKFKVLEDTCFDKAELNLILTKLLDVTLSQHRRRLERYERELREFEERYDMESETFYRRFEAGELGDAMDFFEWAGLYELGRDVIEKIRCLEMAS
jgi:hypothetical protein